MMGVRTWRVLIVSGTMLMALSLPAQQAKPKYGVEEYNEFTAAVNEADPAKRMQALDGFIQKYPQSALSAFVFQAYAMAAQQAQRWPKVADSSDRFLSLNRDDVVALYKHSNYSEQQINVVYYHQLLLHTYGFLLSFRDDLPQADQLAGKAMDYARRGLQVHAQVYEQATTPANVTPEQFEQIKHREAAAFHNVLAATAFRKKDFETAAREYKLVAEQDPNNGLFAYRQALSYLQVSPPQHLPGFWALARAAALLPDNQKKNVRDNLVRNLTAYQAFAEGCPTRHVETQANELIAKAKSAITPPADWTLPDAQQVSTLRNELPVKRIFDDLKGSGEQRHLIWVASCGIELPELTGDVLEVLESADNLVTLRLAVGEENSTTPNVEVKVKAPPEAKNLKPPVTIRFSGVLTDYQAEPFLLRLTEGKVNPEDIPKAETPATAPKRRRPSP